MKTNFQEMERENNKLIISVLKMVVEEINKGEKKQ